MATELRKNNKGEMNGSGRDAAVPKEAATVIVCRPCPSETGHDYQVLFVKRKETARFMPGFYVFPGGIVEPSDTLAAGHALRSSGGDLQEADLRVRMAAIRETFEESNVLLCKPEQPLSTLSEWRPRVLKDCTQFLDMCNALQCRPDFGGLHPWARWITPEAEKYRYDTHFFLIPLSPTQRDHAKIDDFEVTNHVWLSPKAALEKYDSREVKLAPPTWVMVAELSQLPTLADVVRAGCAGRDVRPIIPRFRFPQDDTEDVSIALPGDAESHNPVSPSTRRRIVLPQGQPFRFEQSSDIDSQPWDARPRVRSNL